jgi:serine/threonine protein kinase
VKPGERYDKPDSDKFADAASSDGSAECLRVHQSGSAMLPSLVGRVLGGRYEVQEILGEGGMSFVYRCLHRSLNQTVAVKVLHIDRAYSQKMFSDSRRRRRRLSPSTIPI